MLDIPAIPDLRSTHLTTFTVKAGGVALGAEYGLQLVEVLRQVNRIPRATVVLSDGDAASADFKVSAEQTLIPGVEIEILGGYSSVETTLFKGVITRHRIELGPRFSRLVIEAKDAAFRMTLARVSRSFTDQTDSDILSGLIGGHAGLSADIQLLAGPLPQILQHQATDWDFLVMRAEVNSALVTVLNSKVSVAAPLPVGLPVAQAIFGQGLRDASLELDAETQLTDVATAAWDPSQQAGLTSAADDAQMPGPGNVSGKQLADAGAAKADLNHPGARDQASVDQWAKAEITRARRAAIRGTVTVQGTDAALPGLLINLGGLGARFSGLALITGVRHRLGQGDWSTEMMIGADPVAHAQRYPVAAPAAAGHLPPMNGLQIAVVAALEGDPAGEGRIQIRLPGVTATDGKLWARQALTDAGDARGTCWRPEVKDEVVIGFLDDDPRDPVILGCLHSSAKVSAIPASDDNHEKAIVTRSGMRIHWDDEKKITTIDTPNGYAITLSEDEASLTLADEHGNTVKMSDKGIALDSPKDIKLTATGDVSIEGKSIKIKASTSATVEGGSSAEFKSGGTTALKGSLVNIN